MIKDENAQIETNNPPPWAEGKQDKKPTENEIKQYLKDNGWKQAGKINIEFDDMMKLWQWNVNIKKINENIMEDKIIFESFKEKTNAINEAKNSYMATFDKATFTLDGVDDMGIREQVGSMLYNFFAKLELNNVEIKEVRINSKRKPPKKNSWNATFKNSKKKMVDVVINGNFKDGDQKEEVGSKIYYDLIEFEKSLEEYNFSLETVFVLVEVK